MPSFFNKKALVLKKILCSDKWLWFTEAYEWLYT